LVKYAPSGTPVNRDIPVPWMRAVTARVGRNLPRPGGRRADTEGADTHRRSHPRYLNPLLYAHPTALRDITQGTNGAFEASAGWDPCTGLGSPIGQQVAAVIGVPLAEQKGSS